MKRLIEIDNTGRFVRVVPTPPIDPKTKEPFKIPNTIKAKLPKKVIGKNAYWVGNKWEYRDIIIPPMTDEYRKWALQRESAEIDKETQSKIFEGFDYDGERFSMSLSAQSNWLYLLTLYSAGQFPASFAIATKDDAEYILTKEKAPGFFQAAAEMKETALSEGRDRKKLLPEKYAGKETPKKTEKKVKASKKR